MNAKNNYKILSQELIELETDTTISIDDGSYDQITLLAEKCGLSKLNGSMDLHGEYFGLSGDWEYQIEIEVTNQDGITRNFTVCYQAESRIDSIKAYNGYEICNYDDCTDSISSIEEFTDSNAITRKLYMMASEQAKRSLLDRLINLNEKLYESISKQLADKDEHERMIASCYSEIDTLTKRRQRINEQLAGE